MPCGLHPLDCAAEHIAPAAGLRCTSPGQWSGACPACHGKHCLSLTVKGSRLLWHCNRKPPCPQEIIRAALTILTPSCITAARRPRGTPARDAEMLALLLDPNVTPTALRLGMLRLLGMTTDEAAAKLGLKRSTRYNAVQILGQNRR